jgi:hypothetical protein
MKKLILFFLLAFSLISFAQDEKYENIFFHNDTMKKYSKISYSKTIKEFLKSEFVSISKTDDSLKNQNEKEIRICLMIDIDGRIKVHQANSQNKLIDDFVINSINKLPKVKPYTNENGDIDWYAITMAFKLDADYIQPVIDNSDKKEILKFEDLTRTPTFKDCNPDLSIEETKECFNEKMRKHVLKYFVYPSLAKDDGIQGRTNIYFIIEKDGSIQDKTIIGGHPILQKQSLQIIEKLPILVSGELNGKEVRVSYVLPILYKYY